MSARSLISVLIAAAALAGAGAGHAQDTQYWNEQYGTRAELLGGAVVGSFLDLSATYYNPGAIIMAENPDVLLSANAFEYITTRMKLDIGRQEVPAATTFGTAPTLFAGLLPKNWAPGRLAYSALTRQQYNVRVSAKEVGVGDVLPQPGVEEFSSEFLFDQRMAENWFGLTWSNRLRDHVGFGVTTYGVYRGQRTRVESLSLVNADTGGRSLTYIDEFDYWHFRFVWKFGLAYDAGPMTLGLAMTTPSVGLFGGGGIDYTRSAIGIDIDGDGAPDDLYGSDYQDGLDAHYKSPVSVAAGGSYHWSKASLHVSAEWFNGVAKYDVIETGDIPEIFAPFTIARRVSQELGSVFNVGTGVEYEFTDHLTCYGAFTTDQSASIPGSTTRHSVSTWDIYHVSAGSALRISGLDLTLGIRYSFGNRAVSESYSSVPSLGGDLLAGSEFEYRAWKGILGFAFSI